MALLRNHHAATEPRFSLRSRAAHRRNARLRLQYELLEPRHLLANDIGVQASAAQMHSLLTESPEGYTPASVLVGVQALAAPAQVAVQRASAQTQALATESPKGYTPTEAPITWFETFSNVSRVPLASLASVDRLLPEGIVGPQQLAVGEWIVQLTDSAIAGIERIPDLKALFQTHSNLATFEIIKGLGSEGLILIRAEGASRADIEASISSIAEIEHFGLNQLIQGQDVTPSDTDFVRGAMPSLNLIGMPVAWQQSIGSLNTVVGVLDTGIDLAHRDLYLNIWLNQGEIPARFFAEDGAPLLKDIDSDGLITFYDLNHATRSSTDPFELTVAGFKNGPNKAFVEELDLNGNGYIDALDILASPLWADGRDTDGNGEVDDFFGLNLRGEGLAPNNPMDTQGHGTHVAGTIGAVGGNSLGVTGINWQVSLMPLRILDSSNQGDTGSALRAVNYAKKMRERYRINDAGRVVEGANVRVLNNSWGQPGGFEQTLETAISESGEAGILFVAAAGNGNFLGQGVDNDRTPFYPASYNSPNIIAVAASTLDDQLATFSNFGKLSVDIAAPGVAVRSTELGGGFGTRNGTSMATPHIAGTAALIWSALPAASVSEVSEAILATAEQQPERLSALVSQGRVDTASATSADVFAPVVRLLSKQDIITGGGTSSEFTVVFTHPSGIDPATVGTGDFLIARQWGADQSIPATLKEMRVLEAGRRIEATYVVPAFGGTWDPLDFGQYLISSVANEVRSIRGRGVRAGGVGAFSVRIEDPSFIYVDSFADAIGTKSLRDGIIEANAAAPVPRFIILDAGTYHLSIPPTVDPDSSFPTPDPINGALSNEASATWSGEGTGDLDVLGNVTIFGSRNDRTVIDANGIDRAFRVHQGGVLNLNRVTVQGGVAPIGQGGGGILSQGSLTVNQSNIRSNRTQPSETNNPLGGGGIAAWDGSVVIDRSWIDQNQADIGAAIFLRGNATGIVRFSTISNQIGGGIHSISNTSTIIENTTLSANTGGEEALFAELQGIIRDAPPPPSLKTRSADDRFQVIGGVINSNVPQDTNGFADVYVFDSFSNTFELISVSSAGELANGPSNPTNVPFISSDGRFVVFESRASNLVSNDTNEAQDIFVHDRLLRSTSRLVVGPFGEQANGDIDLKAISDDATRILFTSRAANLKENASEQLDLYLFDRSIGQTTRVTQSDDFDFSITNAVMSGDGRFLAFSSNGRNIVPDDSNNRDDVFVFEVATGDTERVSVATDGTEASSFSLVTAISNDGQFVYFFSDARELDPANPIVGVGEFVRDRQLNETFLRSAPSNAASIFARQVTIFDERVMDDEIVSGRVTLDNSLLAVRNPQPLGDNVTRTNVIGPERFGVLLVSPLVAIRNEPPVHELSIENPAINSGTLRFGLDQRGQFRGEFPDVGAVEAITGSFEAELYVDFNGNRRRDLNEPGIEDILVRAQLQNGLVVGETRTGRDDPSTLDTNEQGLFRFSSLRSDVYQFVFGVPEEFQFSPIPIEEIRRTPERVSLTRDGSKIAFSSNATNLVAGDGNGKQDVFVLDRITKSVQRISRGIMGAEPNGDSSQPSISADGRIVAYTSKATNLAVSDDEDVDDVFIFDSLDAVTTRISVVFRDPFSDDIGGNGNSHSPQVSADGSFVAFVSAASTLSPNDTNGEIEDVFIYDISRDEVSLISDLIIGEGGAAGASRNPVINGNGRVIAFTTWASGYQHREAATPVQDTNTFSDVVYLQRSLGGLIDPISALNIASQGQGSTSSNGNSHSPSIDTAGSSIAFVSDATNLVEGDENGVSDIFVLRQIGSAEPELMRLMPNQSLGIEADGPSHSPSLSGDGRFIVFVSRATNWVEGQVNDQESIYLYSLSDGRVRRLSETSDGQGPNGRSSAPTFSSDGRFVSFNTLSTNLFAASTTQVGSSVVVPNPLVDATVSFQIRPGQQLTNLSFGLIPDRGAIGGRIFMDELVPNSQFDIGEDVLSGTELFLDFNRNGRHDSTEPLTTTGLDGNYQFVDVPSLQDLVVVVNVRAGLEQVSPERRAAPGFAFKLPAGGMLNNLDVGLRTVTTSGQSSDSTIRGRVMLDTNGNGVVDNGDTPVVGRTVFLDGGTLGVRDFNDPQAVTNEDGVYEFTGLPATVTPLRVLLDRTLEQTAPVGSSFSLQKFPFQGIEKREGNPQSVVTGLFNQDTFPDVAVLLADTNALSIRFNDKNGGFSSQMIDISLSDLVSRKIGAQQRFLQPTAIVAGNFDANPAVDIAITGNFSSNILVLRNFDVANFDPAQDKFGFADAQLIPVGNEPLDIIAGQFGGDAATDLVVLNKGDNQVRVLTNNGSGTFAAGAPIATGGVFPASLAVADFNADGKQDIAVTHSIASPTNTTAGRVTVLIGDGNGGLALSPNSYAVQAGAVDSAVGDFNGDKRPDLAVVNFRSNSISVLLGKEDGTLQVQATTLGTTQGAVDIAVADIDNDGDDDILASKLQLREVAIFRNVTPRDPVTGIATGEVRFEPQESIGLGRFAFAERSPFVLANLDNDTSGPRGTGTIDIIAVPQNTDTLFVLKNTLVQGARRAAVSGARNDVASGVDFLIRSAILPPSFDVIPNPLPIFEDAAVQSIDVKGIVKGRMTGPPLQVTATSSNPAVLSSLEVTYTGGSEATIRYTPLADVNNRTTDSPTVITVRAVDAGADGVFDSIDDGVFERSFTVSVLAVNDAPTFNVPAELTVSQKAAAQTIADFVTGITRGGGNDELMQTLSSFTVTANPDFFSVPPSIDAAGALTFTPNPNRSGAVPVTVTLSDNGGKENGGMDSTTKTFVLNVLPVNDPPTFTLGGNQNVNSGAGVQTVNNFATNFQPGGGADEATQVVSDYLVTVDTPGLFAVLPDISNTGTLTFTPAIDRSGTATVNVQVRDSGGRTNGGDDLSTPQVFTITVSSRNKVLKPRANAEVIDLATLPAQELVALDTIDLTGFGSNQLRLSAARIKDLFADSTAIVIAEPDDTIVFDGTWVFDGIEIVDGVAFRTFSQDGAFLRLKGPQTFTNPMNRFDVDSDGKIAAIDALRIINALSRRVVVDASGIFTPITSGNLNSFRFYDTNLDNKLTPLDALVVINALARINRGGSSEGELAVAPTSRNSSVADELNRQDSNPPGSGTISTSKPSSKVQTAESSFATNAARIEAVDDVMRSFGSKTDTNEKQRAGVTLLSDQVAAN